MKRKSGDVVKVLFRFVKQVVSLAQKLTDTSLMQLSHPAGNGFPGWKHAVLHYLRIHMEATYEEVIDWAEEMDRVRPWLSLRPGELPAPSALCRSFYRAPMRVWRALLRRSAELLNHNGHAAIDATFFDRGHASRHYARRSERSIQTLKATFLVDTAQNAVIDVHCSARWLGDVPVGEQVARRNAGDLRSLAADKGYDSQSFREGLRSQNIRPLIKHCIRASYDHAHNARIDDALYGQRWVCETAFSAIKRTNSDTARARTWYCEFREIILKAAVYNVEQALKQ